MKILISDDDTQKFEILKDIVINLIPNAEVIRTVCAKDTIIELCNNNDFDFVIQDMFLPINKNEHIDIKGGIYTLNQMKFRNINTKVCICSSDYISHSFMVVANFKHIPFINFASSFLYDDLVEFFGLEN